MIRLFLPGVFKNTLFGLSETSGVISIHTKLWVLIEVYTMKKKNVKWKGKLLNTSYS